VREWLPNGVGLIDLGRNKGFAGAANIALHLARESGADEVAIGSHDVMPSQTCLATLLGTMKARSDYGIVGPVFVDAGTQEILSCGGVWFGTGGASHKRLLPAARPEIADVLAGDWLHGALLMIRRACAEAVGGFDESLFAYCEDVDYCLRALDAGWKVGAVWGACASEQGSSVGQATHAYYITRNTALLIHKRGGWGKYFLYVARKGGHVVRASVGAAAVWRPRAHRLSSRAFALGQAVGLIDAVRGRTGPQNDWLVTAHARPKRA
jgi:hypothetical protein